MQVQSHDESMFELLRVVWKRRKWLALPIFTAACTAMSGVALSLPDAYRASATVLVNPATLAQSAPGGVASGSLETQFDSVTQQVLSRTRLQDLITRFNLYPELRRQTSLEQVIERMQRDIHVERKASEQQWGTGATIAFTLSYQGWEPQTVAQVSNALAALFVTENSSLRENEVTAMARSLQALKQKLDGQEQQIDAYRSAHMGQLPEQQEANLATLERLNTQLHLNSEDQIHTMEQREDLLKKMSETGDLNLPQLQQQLAELRTRFTDQYPDVARVKAQIATLQKQKGSASAPADSAQQQLQQLDAQLTGLKAEETRLRQATASYQSRVETVPLTQQQLQQLTQGYDTTRDLYSSELKQYEQMQLAVNSGPQGDQQFRILDPALAPRDPFGPNRLRLLLMAFLLSLGMAAAAVVLAEQLDTSFHTLHELRAFTRVPVLARIPPINTPDDIRKRRLKTGAAALLTVLALALILRSSYGLGHGNHELVWLLTQHSA